MPEEIKPLPPPTKAQNRAALGLVLLIVAVVVVGGWYLRTHRGGAPRMTSTEQGRGGSSELRPIAFNSIKAEFKGQFRMPQSQIQMEFRDAQGQLIDVGQVKLALDMPMPGMVMHNDAAVTGSGGRYTAKVRHDMAGQWNAKLTYSGAAGSGEKTFQVTVR